jgi:hypothetical protein
MRGRAKPRQASEGASDRFARRVNDSLFNFLVVEKRYFGQAFAVLHTAPFSRAKGQLRLLVVFLFN